MSEERESEQVSTVNQESGNSKKKGFFRVPEWSLKRGLVFGTALVLLLCVLVGLASLWRMSSIGKTDKITIGNITITKADIDRYITEYNAEKANNTSLITTNEDGKEIDTRQMAIDSVVLNAALKYEAEKQHVRVSNKDIAQVLGEGVPIEKTLSQYMRRINVENDAYEAKLADKLLAKKDLFVVSAIFDTPYFNRAPQDKVKGYYDQAKQRLQRDVLPLMKAGKSKEEVAKQVDTVWFDDDKTDDKDWEQYFNKAVITADIKNGYLQNGFNDLDDKSYIRAEVGKLFGTDDKVATLKKVGDTTDVFASKSGAYMIIRLEAKSSGIYGSWEEMLTAYKKQYITEKVDLAAAFKNGTSKLLNAIASIITSIGMEKVQAAPADCSKHSVAFVLRAYDTTTGSFLSGAQVEHYRAPGTHQCEDYPGQFTGTHPLTSGSSNTYVDNCLGPDPTWNNNGPPNDTNHNDDGPTRHPAGYDADDFLGVYWGDQGTPRSDYQKGWPEWIPARINQATGGKIYIELRYRGDPPQGLWNLVPASFVSTFNGSPTDNADWEKGQTINAAPGDTVYFRHTLDNTGNEDATSIRRWRVLVTKNPDGSVAASTNVDVVPSATIRWDANPILYTPQNAADRAFTVPSGVPPGTLYCQYYAAEPRRKGVNGNIDPSTVISNEACVQVSYWTPTLQSTALGPASNVNDWVEQGQRVAFQHSVTNNGNVWMLIPNLGSNYIRNYPLFNYNYNNPAAAPASLYQGPEGCAWYSNFVAPGETRYYGQDTSPTCAAPLGQTLDVPNTAALSWRYCQGYRIFPSSSLNMSVGADSTTACTTVVGGKAEVSTNPTAGSTRYIEPTESSSIDIILGDNDFWKGSTSWPGYNVTCSYTVTTSVPGLPTTTSTVPGGCNDSMTARESKTVATYTLASTAATAIGTKVCVTATISAATGPSGAPNPNLLSATTTSNETCIDVIARPYFKVFGSDVSVGRGIGSCESTASVVSWNRGSTGGYTGAGAQYAVLARNTIYGFTGTQKIPGPTTSGYAASPLGLNFTNAGITPPITNNNYGGTYLAGQCNMDDYYNNSSKPSNPPAWPGSLAAAQADLDPEEPLRQYSHNTNLTLAGGDVILKANTVLYVDGNLFINGNIQPTGTPTAIEDVPLLTVIVQGDIYISSNVTNLYGTFIAQHNGSSGGNIYTCANNYTRLNPTSASSPPGNSAYTTCGNQLTVTGSFVATKKIFLDRTHGSQYLSGSDTPGSNQAGEVFQYNPLVWMRQSTTPDPGGSFKLEALTSLPPIL